MKKTELKAPSAGFHIFLALGVMCCTLREPMWIYFMAMACFEAAIFMEWASR